MSWTLHRIDVTSGRYRGLLTGEGTPPALCMELGDEVLGNLEVTPVEGGWQVEGDLGGAPLTEGAQTVAIRIDGGALLDTLTVVTGLGAPEDLRAELGALRAELSILKAAFRRHVTEG